MNDTANTDGNDTSSLDGLQAYTAYSEPVIPVITYGTLLLVASGLVYAFLGIWVPDHPAAAYPLFSRLFDDYPAFAAWVQQYLTVPWQTRWDRLMLLSYLALYIGMWWAYFASKKYPADDPRERRSLKIQSLRRLLGETSRQWQPHSTSTRDDDEAIQAFRRKGETSMQVIAILIAVSILIFDQISNIWMTGNDLTLWQDAVLWTGMLAAMVSFICFMMCVDSLDTIFNRFTNDPVRNVLVKYFYGYTLTPRYAGGAAMLLSIILLLGFHSELLGSLAVIAILLVGYNLWFPDIRGHLNAASDAAVPSARKSHLWYATLLLMPVFARLLLLVSHA